MHYVVYLSNRLVVTLLKGPLIQRRVAISLPKEGGEKPSPATWQPPS